MKLTIASLLLGVVVKISEIKYYKCALGSLRKALLTFKLFCHAYFIVALFMPLAPVV